MAEISTTTQEADAEKAESDFEVEEVVVRKILLKDKPAGVDRKLFSLRIGKVRKVRRSRCWPVG